MANELELDSEGARSFAHFTMEASSGAVQADASREFRDFLQKMRHRAQQNGSASGAFSLSFAFKLDGDTDEVELSYSIKSKVPEPKRRKGRMYLTPGGHLMADNPRQRSLPHVEAVKPPRPMTDHASKQGA